MGVVEQELGSYAIDDYAFVYGICNMANQVHWCVIEDIPHRMRFDSGVRAVCRLQGRIIHQLHDDCFKMSHLVFLPPDTWQRWCGVWRVGKNSREHDLAVVAKAQELGYQPPSVNDIYPEYDAGHNAKERGEARKQQSDYCAAFLIGQWAHKTLEEAGTLAVRGANPYSTV